MAHRLPAVAIFLLLLLLVTLLSAADSKAPAGTGASPSAVQYREDINGDGKIHMTDVIALLILGRDEPDNPRADYDGDGGYAVNDVITLLLNIRGGKLTPEPLGQTEVVQGITMVCIPGGSFRVAGDDGQPDELPADTVDLKALWMAQTEITQEQYREVTGISPSFFAGKESYPVERVSWYDAVRFCNRLSALAGLDSCYNVDTWECDFTRNGFRLPNETEWEYACRAGTDTRYHTGDTESKLYRAGWYFNNSSGATHPSGRKEPNIFGLYDMHGNVWEWCHDRFERHNSPGDSPDGTPGRTFRICRGGAWDYQAFYCRSAFRNYDRPEARFACIGFRVVRGLF